MKKKEKGKGRWKRWKSKKGRGAKLSQRTTTTAFTIILKRSPGTQHDKNKYVTVIDGMCLKWFAAEG